MRQRIQDTSETWMSMSGNLPSILDTWNSVKRPIFTSFLLMNLFLLKLHDLLSLNLLVLNYLISKSIFIDNLGCCPAGMTIKGNSSPPPFQDLIL